jgi:hypothetical protein
MKWLVCINSDGIQCQIPIGKDPSAAAKEASGIKKHAKVQFIFEFGEGGHDPDSNDYQDRRTFEDFLNIRVQRLHAKYFAASPGEVAGYNVRKAVAIGDGLEVLADLDANDYKEFHNKYSGTKGAKDILYSTERVMSGGGSTSESAAKAVDKLIRKLEIEED